MVIRVEQMEALGRAQKEIFLQQAIRHFANYFPQVAQGPEWEGRLRGALVRADSEYGLKNERDLFAFADMCGGLGWDFDQEPENAWMRECLLNKAVTRPEDRMTGLLRRIQRREEVEKQNAALRQSFLKR
jgi:hypothetical protein